MNQNLGQPVKNKHKVPKKQWNRWSNFAQRMFNDVMYAMRPSMQSVLIHPGSMVMGLEHWKVLRWNAAWLAADAANDKKRKPCNRKNRNAKKR